MAIFYYPIALKLKQKNVLVVGGGRIAERKTRALLSFGARVKIVAPDFTEGILGFSRRGRISLANRRYGPEDLKGSSLVVAATSDRKLNKKIGLDAARKGIWANVVDDTAACGFISMAIIKKKGLVISISTDGKNPRLSKDFKEFLKRKIDEFDSGRHKS